MRHGLIIGALAAVGIGAILWRGYNRRSVDGRDGADRARFPEDPGGPWRSMTPDECADIASEDSFPASDPPAYTLSRAGRPAN